MERLCNMKKLSGFLTAVLLIACLVLCASAADTLYVKSAAAGDGSGKNADNATTFDAALTQLSGKGGTLVLCEEVYVRKNNTVIPEQSGDLTITAKDGGSLYVQIGSLTLAKNTNDNTFVLDAPVKTLPSGLMFFAGFNSVHFTENCTVDGSIHFFGGVNVEKAPSNTTTGEVEEKKRMNQACITELPYTITVENGIFGSFSGGSYRDNSADVIGSITAPLTVNISGGTFNGTRTFQADEAIKSGRAFSLSGMGLLCDDAKLTVTGGTFNTPIYVHGYLGETTTAASAASMITNSDAKYYAADGDVTVVIKGGTFAEGCVEISAEQTAASYNRLHRGNFKVTVEKDASFVNTVFDATQVKAYAGKTQKATLTYPSSAAITVKRFDTVNGKSRTYEEPIRIACVGDSITQGTSAIVGGKTDYENWAYPAQLYKKAIENGDDVIISNYGCGATKVLDYSGLYYRAGLAYTLSADETDATYVVIGLGTNDSGTVANTVGQIDHFKKEYADLVLSYEKNPDTKTVFGTSAIYRYRYAYNAASCIRVLQDEVLTSLKAEGKKCQYIDLYALLLAPALDGSLLHTDLLHPNAKGYTLYADAIYDAVFNGVYYNEDFKPRSDIWVDQIKGTVDGDGSKEHPVKHMSVAFALADKEATIHIVGVYTDTNYKADQQWNTTITPMNVDKLTIVGEGEGAEWRLSSKMLFVFGDVTFDNVKMYYSLGTGGNALYIFCGFNNVTFTETFSTPAPEYGILFAGFDVHDDLITQGRYTPAESVSSDKDCTITINGGKFLYFVGGNLHFNNANADQAPYGTYSGNMTINIGSGATFKDNYAGGALVGMNYMAGTVTASIQSWNKNMPIYSFSKLTNQSVCARSYDESNNTGANAISVRTPLDNQIVLSGDLNADGRVALADVLLLARYAKDGLPSSFDTKTYFYQAKVTEENAKRLVQVLAN